MFALEQIFSFLVIGSIYKIAFSFLAQAAEFHLHENTKNE
jgi:hypothetical protein